MGGNLLKMSEADRLFEKLGYKKIEDKYNKNEILELYLNTSYFGDGYETVKEASRGYFGKEPLELTDYEAVMLAGIPNAPSVYAPTKNPKLAKQRQEQVLNKMVKYKYLTEEEAQKMVDEIQEETIGSVQRNPEDVGIYGE